MSREDDRGIVRGSAAQERADDRVGGRIVALQNLVQRSFEGVADGDPLTHVNETERIHVNPLRRGERLVRAGSKVGCRGARDPRRQRIRGAPNTKQ